MGHISREDLKDIERGLCRRTPSSGIIIYCCSTIEKIYMAIYNFMYNMYHDFLLFYWCS